MDILEVTAEVMEADLEKVRPKVRQLNKYDDKINNLERFCS